MVVVKHQQFQGSPCMLDSVHIESDSLMLSNGLGQSMLGTSPVKHNPDKLTEPTSLSLRLQLVDLGFSILTLRSNYDKS